jgi:hypothetical protein
MSNTITIIRAVTTRQTVIPAGRKVELHDEGSGFFRIMAAETNKGEMLDTDPFTLFLRDGDFQRAGAAAAPAPVVPAMSSERRRQAAAVRALVSELNRVIHSRNLYCGHSRFINAGADTQSITVENLQTGERVPFVNDGSFRDGMGEPVIIRTEGKAKQ